MVATTLNFTDDDRIEAGATFRRFWEFEDAETTGDFDLTSFAAASPADMRAHFRTEKDSAELCFEASISSSSPSEGHMDFEIAAADTAAWALQNPNSLQGVWDLEIDDGAGYIVRLLEGTWHLSNEVTRQ